MLVYGECECFVMQMLYVCVLYGTPTHLLGVYISANQRFIFTFLSKITKYNRDHWRQSCLCKIARP